MFFITLISVFFSALGNTQTRAIGDKRDVTILSRGSADNSVVVLPVHWLKGPTGNPNYLIYTDIGSNSQPLALALDISSHLTWTNPNCSILPKEVKSECEQLPRYSPQTSSTSKFPTDIGWGTEYQDTIHLGGIDLEIDIVDRSSGSGKNLSDRVNSSNIDIMGHLGLGEGVGSIPQLLFARGVTKNQAFGMSLATSNNLGSITFGGLDTKKYKCRLEKFSYGVDQPLIYQIQRTPRVDMTAVGLSIYGNPYTTIDPISVNPSPKTFSQGVPGLFFSAIQAQYLGAHRISIFHPRLLHTIGSTFPTAKLIKLPFAWNSEPQKDFDFYAVPCQPPDGSIDFVFGKSTNISVPWYQFIIHHNSGRCVLAMTTPSTKGEFNGAHVQAIGSAIMERVYMVFDYESSELWIGQTDDCGSNIVPIPEGSNAVSMVDGCDCKRAEGHPGGAKNEQKMGDADSTMLSGSLRGISAIVLTICVFVMLI